MSFDTLGKFDHVQMFDRGWLTRPAEKQPIDFTHNPINTTLSNIIAAHYIMDRGERVAYKEGLYYFLERG